MIYKGFVLIPFMKLLEMKNKLALETVKLLFNTDIKDIVFIGGTALNVFYLDYRYSEDLDIGYLQKNVKSDIEELLREKGYSIERTNFKFRDVLTLEGTSLKMDIIEYKIKFGSIEEKLLGQTKVKTLSLEEFAVEKTISFFSRENTDSLARDAYDLFSISRKTKLLEIINKAKKIIKHNIVTTSHNVELLKKDRVRVEASIATYLKKEIKYPEVVKLIDTIKGIIDG